MKCSICGSALPPGADRCPSCGYRAPNAYTAPADPGPRPRSVRYDPPNKSRGSRGCCCALAVLLPIAIFLMLVVWAAVDFLAAEFETDIVEPGFFEEMPFLDPVPESLPAAADEGCFAVVEHTLMFLPENWDGSPILRIPEYVGGELVTNLGPGCFQGCADLTTILLPDSVTAISPMAFSGCTQLRGLYLPDGAESIGSRAFEGCVSLEAIYIPVSVNYIAEGCFDDCASLRYIFYGGMFEDWEKVYSGYINPFTTAVCLDGSYYHGAEG